MKYFAVLFSKISPFVSLKKNIFAFFAATAATNLSGCLYLLGVEGWQIVEIYCHLAATAATTRNRE